MQMIADDRVQRVGGLDRFAPASGGAASSASFITPPNEVDVLMIVMGIFLVAAVLWFGH
ncbi:MULTISPECIES: hypothetical protein [Bradyrhizobium]|uniref:hypothetical protein n=1 Tax=Bradyrhizobium TaxID=374 RepID=UPI0003F5AD58|nr:MULTISPECIES: hypothetical protein [Bradyrhizobium]